MTSLGLTYTLLSSVGWALFDTSRKGLLRHMKPLPALVWLMVGQVPLFATWWIITQAAALPSLEYVVPGIATVTLNVAASLMYLEALRIAPISRMVPLLSLTPVLTAVTGFVTLGEWPTWVQLAGIVLVAVGTWVVTQGESVDGDEKQTRRGAWLMIAVATAWSLTAAIDKVALRSASPPFHGLIQTAGSGVCVLAFLTYRGELEQLRLKAASGKWLLGGVGAACVGMGLQFVALQYVLVTLVETMKRAIGMTLALVLGRVLFEEALTWKKAVAISIMAIGVALVLW